YLLSTESTVRYTLSLHDALPISTRRPSLPPSAVRTACRNRETSRSSAVASRFPRPSFTVYRERAAGAFRGWSTRRTGELKRSFMDAYPDSRHPPARNFRDHPASEGGAGSDAEQSDAEQDAPLRPEIAAPGAPGAHRKWTTGYSRHQMEPAFEVSAGCACAAAPVPVAALITAATGIGRAGDRLT